MIRLPFVTILAATVDHRQEERGWAQGRGLEVTSETLGSDPTPPQKKSRIDFMDFHS